MIIILFLLVVVLSYGNYVPGTILSGWDTIHPEFNWPLYFQRVIFGVWQEVQGLGAVAAQGHASELSRLLIYYPLSGLIDLNNLRYFYIFLTLLVGTLGSYFFINKLTSEKLIAFTGSLVYLFNLGTLQQYLLPLEMFATHFATLPWLFLFVDKPLPFFVASFFAGSIAHTPTLFYVLFGVLAVYLVVLRKKFKEIIVLLGGMLIVNSFWLLPNIYFVVTSGQEVMDSKISSQFSEKAFLTERNSGSIPNTMILKNYLFDWGKYDNQTGNYVTLLKPWSEHLENSFVIVTGYSVFVFALLGILISFKKNNSYGKALLPIFIISFFAIANGTYLISGTFDLLRQHIPVLGEALRFPFTKFSLILAFTFAVYVSLFLKYFLNRKIFLVIFLTIFIPVLFFYFLPAFGGNFIDKKMEVKIPQEYFSTMSWLNSQNQQGRVANFPVDNYWGWVYYQWDYEGAGFWWFGVERPMMNREFDRWSPYNENYYWEMSNAVYSKSPDLLRSVLEKYQISYLLVDENVINPVSPKALYYDEIKSLIGEIPQIMLAKTFGNISVYKYSPDTPLNNYVYFLKDAPAIGPKYKWNNRDQGFLDYGHYITEDQNPDIYYPYRSLFTGRKQEELEFNTDVIPKTLIASKTGNFIELPSLDHRNAYLIEFSAKNISGQPFLFWIENLNSRRSDLETYLPKNPDWKTYYFIEPPTDPYGMGYNLHFDNVSIGDSLAINEHSEVKIYQIPYRELVTKKQVTKDKKAEILEADYVSHPNPAFYEIKNIKGDTLVLSQSYNDGWLAINNWRILPGHVLIDNWANGWKIDGSITGPVYLFFWPQLLEFLGFILLGGLICFGLLHLIRGQNKYNRFLDH